MVHESDSLNDDVFFEINLSGVSLMFSQHAGNQNLSFHWSYMDVV